MDFKLDNRLYNGVLPLKCNMALAKIALTIYGGPYDNYAAFKTPETFGVCVRAERVPKGLVDVHVPIVDFNVPRPADRDKVEAAILLAFQAAMDGKKVFVGCMGGWGRTGLFLAIMAKAFGIADPVGYVREHYTPHAVETPAQKTYVEDFDVSAIHRKLSRMAWKTRLPKFLGWWL